MSGQPEERRVDVAVASDGAALKFWSYGFGPRTLLLVSGLGGTGAFWKEVAPTLAENMRIIVFDQRGIGASTRGTATVTIEQLAKDCFAVLDAAGAQASFLLGHSTGGCIVQECAQLAPERVEGLILSAAWMRRSRYMNALFQTRREILEMDPVVYAKSSVLLSYPPSWLEDNWNVFETAVKKAPMDPFQAKIIRERIDALLSFDGPLRSQVLKLRSLILGAYDDMIVPPFLQEELSARLPLSQIRMLKNGGHFFPVSRSDDFVDEVSRWLVAP